MGTAKRTPPEDPRPGDVGGETVCWAHLVCPECGRMADGARPEVCAACGAEFPD